MKRVHLGRLRVRVHARTAHEGRQLGLGVARALAEASSQLEGAQGTIRARTEVDRVSGQTPRIVAQDVLRGAKRRGEGGE